MAAVLLVSVNLVRLMFEPQGTAGFVIFLCAYVIIYLIIGYDILRKAIKGIINRRPFDECFLMAFATLGAFALAI